MADDQQKAEQRESQERSSPSGRVVYHAILTEAEDELARPSSALFWSGLAAGLSMGFSLIAQGLLRAHLPHEHWQPLVSKFGYCAGFLIVILGRQQLFTENTLTPVLPLLRQKDARTLLNMLRLWGVVLVSNLIGALIVAWAAVGTSAFDAETRRAFLQVGEEAMQHPFGTTVLKGVFAGWLIALIVWLLPFAETARVWVIILLTYLVGLGHFNHIVAGAVDVFALAWADQRTWGSIIFENLVPTLIGNIIGGVTLVAAISHAQVMSGGSKRLDA